MIIEFLLIFTLTLISDEHKRVQLIGVHVSSIHYEVIRTISSLIFFFYEKNLNISNDFHSLRSFCVRENLLPLLVFVPLFLFFELVFACDMFMWA